MNGIRAMRWPVAGAAAAGVLLLAGCGGRQVTFTPAADSSTAVASGATPPGSANGASAASVATPSNLVITTQGSTVCVRDRTTGSQACVGRHGTAVVNGVVIVDGKVVATSGAGTGGGSVVVDGGASVVSGGTVPSVPTAGQVTLAGARQWQGRVSGTCRRSGDVRHAEVGLGNGDRLEINAVGGGVVQIELSAGADSYSGNWVGDGGIVSVSAGNLTVHDAQVGRGSATVRVNASLNC